MANLIPSTGRTPRACWIPTASPLDRAQAHKAEDARAQRQGGEEPQDRPGKILQDPSVPFPQGPEGAGREMGEEIQRNAQDDA